MKKQRWPKTAQVRGIIFKAELSILTYNLLHDTIVYRSSGRSKTVGSITLPDGWQDMDRTWTAQDIYWKDKYDCITVQEGVLLN